MIFRCVIDGADANGNPLVMLSAEPDEELWLEDARGHVELCFTNPDHKHTFEQEQLYDVTIKRVSKQPENPVEAPESPPKRRGRPPKEK